MMMMTMKSKIKVRHASFIMFIPCTVNGLQAHTVPTKAQFLYYVFQF